MCSNSKKLGSGLYLHDFAGSKHSVRNYAAMSLPGGINVQVDMHAVMGGIALRCGLRLAGSYRAQRARRGIVR